MFYTDPVNGKVYELPIISLIVLKTVMYLDDTGQDPSDGDLVSQNTHAMAYYLEPEGWFSEEEFLAALAHEEVEHVDEELWKMSDGTDV